MKRESIISRRFKMVMAAFIISVSPVLPLFQPNSAAADGNELECGPRVAMINGGFEEPMVTGKTSIYLDQGTVPGWKTTDSSGKIEVWRPSDNLPTNAHQPASGKQMAELNAYENGMLYQDVATEPGQTIYWRLAHKGRNGVDTMRLRIGPATQNPYDTQGVREMTDGNTQWGYYSGTYTVPAGQTVTRFGFEAVSSANGNVGAGNFVDDIFLGTAPCGVVTKSVNPVDHVQEGDTLTYTVHFKNEGGDETGNTVFTDNIPDGTEYVPGSLEIVSGPNSGKLTDAKGDDQGEFMAGENRVVVRLGNGANASQAGRIPNTVILPGGTTVQFKVKILSKYKTTAVANKATVEYDNLLSGKHETRGSNGVTIDVNRPPIAPDFEETTWKNTSVTGSVYGVDANGDPLTFNKGSDPLNGTLTVNPDGTWTYVPDDDFTGQDSFTVIVSDGKGGTSTSTVTVNVQEPPNRPPVTDNYNVTTPQDTSVTGSVYGTDPDGDPPAYAIETKPKHGTVTLNPDGTWTYEPDSGYAGPDIFTVIVSDGRSGVTTSTVTLNVTEKPNHPPAAPDKQVTTEKGKSVTGAVYGTDPDGDPLTYTKGRAPEHGVVTINPDGTWTYTPNPDFVGKDSFTVIVDDGKGNKTEVTIVVDVKEPETPPTNDSDSGSKGSSGKNKSGTVISGSETLPAEPENGAIPTIETESDSTDSEYDVLPPSQSGEQPIPGSVRDQTTVEEGNGEPSQEDRETNAGESAKADSPAARTDLPQGNKLPNTATNLYNLGLIGMVLLLSGWLLRRKRKA